MSSPMQQQQQQHHSRSPSNSSGGAPSPSHFKSLGEYILLKKGIIGRGAYAAVHDGFKKKENTPVAIKVIERSKLNDKLMENLEQEISIMKQIRHDNIIRLFEEKRSRRNYYLIMEKCTGGDLKSFMAEQRRPLPEAVAKKLLIDLAYGLHILTSLNLIHRDLKPANLLLDQRSTLNAMGTLKIADFGFAREVKPDDMASTLCGSPLYMAPEVLAQKRYDARADLWSVGTIFYEMLFGRAPYMATSMPDLLRVILKTRLSYPVNVASQGALHLLQGLLQVNPEQRMKFEDFFNHPYLDLKNQPDFVQRSQMTIVPDPSSSLLKSLRADVVSSIVVNKNSEDGSASMSSRDNGAVSVSHNNSGSHTSNNSHQSSSASRGETSSEMNQGVTTDSAARADADTLAPVGTNDAVPPKTTNQYMDNTFASAIRKSHNSNTDQDVDAQYVIVPSHTSVSIRKLESSLHITPSGDIQYPSDILDLSSFSCENVILANEVQTACERAWAIAEAAYLKEKFHKPIEALALYSRSLDLLLDLHIYLQKNSPPHDDRLNASMTWVQAQFDDFLERADILTNRINSTPNNGTERITQICAEDVLYHYALKLAKQSAYVEWSNRDSSPEQARSCVSMYQRSKFIFEYLRLHCDHITNQTDQRMLEGYIQRFQNRITYLL